MTNDNKISEYIYLSLYVSAMLIVAVFMIINNRFAGELDSFNLNADLYEVIFLLFISIIGFFAAYFLYLLTNKSKFYFSNVPFQVSENRLSYFYLSIIFLQIGFLVATGVGRVGGDATNKYSPIFAILNADFLFAIFYFLIRESKVVSRLFFFFIIFSYVALKSLQGWTGEILLIIFFELFFYFKRNSVSVRYKYILVLIFPIFLLLIGGKAYQYVLPYKFEIRGVNLGDISYAEGIENLTNRLTFFPISVGAYERFSEVLNYSKNDDISLREVRGFFRPYAPRFLMENKEFRSINNLVKQPFYPDLEQGTSTDIGLIMYTSLVWSSDIFDGILLLFFSIILLFVNKAIYDSFEQYHGQMSFLYFLLVMKLYYVGSPEIVFAYGSIGSLFFIPLMYVLGIIKTSHNIAK